GQKGFGRRRRFSCARQTAGRYEREAHSGRAGYSETEAAGEIVQSDQSGIQQEGARRPRAIAGTKRLGWTRDLRDADKLSSVSSSAARRLGTSCAHGGSTGGSSVATWHFNRLSLRLRI